MQPPEKGVVHEEKKRGRNNAVIPIHRRKVGLRKRRKTGQDGRR